jgi:protein-tyrosine phosphatase
MELAEVLESKLMNKTNVLFVCLGNICRSPAAEAVFSNYLATLNLQDRFLIDSAATCANHIGEKADARMREMALQRGIEVTSLGRQFSGRDFELFDFIIVMDDSNYENVIEQDVENRYSSKVSKMTNYCSDKYPSQSIVPDPYFGGMEGFEFVLDLLADASLGLLTHIKSRTE